VDSAGNAYVTGYTFSPDFPTANALQPLLGGPADAFVTKLNAAGSALVYSTYLGGSGSDAGSGIAVDSAGDAYVTGWTSSSDFPTVNPIQFVGSLFVAKLNAAGAALVYSTYLGGSSDDSSLGPAVDSAGNAYVTGTTYSSNFPTVNALQPTLGGYSNAFVAKISQASTTTQPPLASFTSTCSGLTCGFDGSSSSDPDGTIISYSWNFGDGTLGSGPTASHTYAAVGTFTVALIVTDNAGVTGAQSKNVTVVSIPPVASFASTCSGLVCSFDGSASSDSDGTITGYSWNFGDGTIGSGRTLNHTYAVAGIYTVTLTVTDNAGATGAQSKSVTAGQAHVGDLDGARSNQFNTWTAVVTITVHDSSHRLVANATVSGSWSGSGGTNSCTTNGSGQCTVSKSKIPKWNASVTFTVLNVTHATLTYASTNNHDPDGDSNGSSITVSRR
jgi:PKD repeat protein